MSEKISLEAALEIAQNENSTNDDIQKARMEYETIDYLLAKTKDFSNINLASEYEKYFFKEHLLESPLLQQGLAQNPSISATTLRSLASRGNSFTRKLVLAHPKATEASKKIISDRDRTMKEELAAKNKEVVRVKKLLLKKVAAFRQKWHEEPLGQDVVRLLSYMERYLNYHPASFAPLYEPITRFGNDYRKDDLVFGHMYTSEKYPWPVCNGRPAAPLLQLKSDTIKTMAKKSNQVAEIVIGNGLLQVWSVHFTQHGNEIIRFIPQEDIDSNPMSDESPNLLDANEYLALAEVGFGTGCGLGARIVGWDASPMQFVNEEWYKDEDIESLSEAAYEDGNSLLDSFRALAVPLASSGGTHLFGVATEFQAAFGLDRLPWQSLFQFDGDGHPEFRIGGFGTAIVYWHGDDFKYVWSPYG